MALFGGILTCLTCVFCVISTQIPYLRDHITPSTMGLAISLVLQVIRVTQYITIHPGADNSPLESTVYYQCTNELSGFVWVMSNVESNIVSVERIKEYGEMEKESESRESCPRYAACIAVTRCCDETQ